MDFDAGVCLGKVERDRFDADNIVSLAESRGESEFVGTAVGNIVLEELVLELWRNVE